MRLKTVQLIKFKRFDDLTIDLGDHPKKIVALVGPNGSGKSAVFDAFEQRLRDHVGGNQNEQPWFYSKTWHDEANPVQAYDRHQSIKVEAEDGRKVFSAKNFYVRTAYRFTPTLRITSIQAKGDPLAEQTPGSSIALDGRLQANYERMHGRLVSTFYKGDKTGTQFRAELIDRINARLAKVLDIRISDLGDPTEGKGQLYFRKGSSKNFPFENLSAGEKEVVDMLIDLEIKTPNFDDTVFCIDEPELHLNTAIQCKLLVELADMIGDNCQLWIATHSVGFLRALQQDLADSSQILDFSEKDYFGGTQTIKPISPTRANWKRIFSTALEDLTGLLAPQTIVYCEGRPDPNPNGDEQGLDARVYNQVFEVALPDVLFVSSGGGGEPKKYTEIALRVLGKAFDGATLRLLRDRDGKTDYERGAFLAESVLHRMLIRREIENYLFDFDVLSAYTSSEGRIIDKAAYDALVPDITTDDLRLGQTLQRLTHLTGFTGSVDEFKLRLPAFVHAGTAAYDELRACVV